MNKNLLFLGPVLGLISVIFAIIGFTGTLVSSGILGFCIGIFVSVSSFTFASYLNNR